MLVQFHSDDSVEHTGFNITYSIIDGKSSAYCLIVSAVEVDALSSDDSLILVS